MKMETFAKKTNATIMEMTAALPAVAPPQETCLGTVNTRRSAVTHTHTHAHTHTHTHAHTHTHTHTHTRTHTHTHAPTQTGI